MKVTKLSMDELFDIVEKSEEIERENNSGLLTVRRIHPRHGEIVWIQGGGDAIMVK